MVSTRPHRLPVPRAAAARRAIAALAAGLVFAAAAPILCAQAQAPAAAAAAAAEDAPATPPANYTYSPDGRRDPFVSLVNRGTEPGPRVRGQRPDGVKGLLVNEVVVRGILRSEGGWIAMVGAPDGKTYTVRTGDRLMDGTVRSINAQMLVFLQDVDDPLSLEKQREVRKPLRGGDEVQ